MGQTAAAYTQQRTKMVDNQLRPYDISHYDVLSAFLSVERHLFVPTSKRELAYSDAEIEIADGTQWRAMMRPMHLARMVQAVDLSPDSVVLDIGCLTGYSSAILAKLAGAVVALEQSEALVRRATDALSDASVDTVAVVEGALADGYAAEGPYDYIFMQGAVDAIPAAIFDQLRDDGQIIAALGFGGSGRAVSVHRDGATRTVQTLFNCSAPPLPVFVREPDFTF